MSELTNRIDWERLLDLSRGDSEATNDINALRVREWDEVHQTIKILAKVMEPFKDISDENLLLNWQRDARKAIRRYNE